MNRRRFQRLVTEALDELPSPFGEHLQNVEVVIEDSPTPEQLEEVGLVPGRDTLFGLYEGTPLPERGHNFGMALPDRITIFYRPLVRQFRNDDELRHEIRTTVIHEIGHFFGMDDDEIEGLGY